MTERETVVLDEGYSLKQVRVMLKLCEAEPLYSTEQLKGPDQATEVMADALARLDREYCCVVNLDSMLRPINFNVVSIGGISRTLVPVQNVFKAAILSNAAGIMLFHNHPSGSLTPSREDVLLTQRLVKAGQLMEIPVLDHVIVGGGGTGRCSLRSEHPKLFCVEEPETYCGGQDKAGHLREPFEITEDRKGDKNLRDEEGCRGAASVAGGRVEKRKTIGEMMEEMRRQAGAKEYAGHSYMDLNRFAEDTRHMVIFDVLTEDSPVGWQGERTRAYLNEEGYRKMARYQEEGHVRIVSHASVRNGHLCYDRRDQVR
ncbi:MAG: JAB domain-containing protein [Lachnospiraceae bacterium]|nr:JAB domain-containing protein [Lachnospiraceae bacterium]